MRQLEETSESGDGVSRFTIDPLELQFGHMAVLTAALEHACALVCALMCMACAPSCVWHVHPRVYGMCTLVCMACAPSRVWHAHVHAQEAALGIESFICPTQESKRSIRVARLEGLPALRREFEANGTDVDKQCMRYVLDGEAGSCDTVWRRAAHAVPRPRGAPSSQHGAPPSGTARGATFSTCQGWPKGHLNMESHS